MKIFTLMLLFIGSQIASSQDLSLPQSFDYQLAYAFPTRRQLRAGAILLQAVHRRL